MSLPYLVFIDDDQEELDELRQIVSDEYDYCPIKWPFNEPLKFNRIPSIIVLDLYFPTSRKTITRLGKDKLDEQKIKVREIAQDYHNLYKEKSFDSALLLRKTFACIQRGYDLLWDQCTAFGQSAENGRKLLARFRANDLFKEVPIIFYSRKVTVSEAVRALQAGASSVVQKPISPLDHTKRNSVLQQFRLAQKDFAEVPIKVRKKLEKRLKSPININVTLLKHEVSTEPKVDVTLVKLG